MQTVADIFFLYQFIQTNDHCIYFSCDKDRKTLLLCPANVGYYLNESDYKNYN